MKNFVLAAVVFATGSAMALTLKEQKQFKAWQEYLKDPGQSYVKTAKDKCGYEIPVTIEDKFTTPFMADNAHAAAYCDAARSSISGMCEDETSKAAIKRSIKKIDCKLGKEKEASFKLSGTTLIFTVGLGASNLEDKTKDFLENNLK